MLTIQNLEQHQEELERKKKLNSALLQENYEQGWFKLFVPEELGGRMTTLPEALLIFEETSRLDGNLGWLVTIGADGGNFSGGHVGMAMDALKIAVASVGDLLERQMELIVDEKFNAGLTPNLIGKAVADGPEAGLHHGFKGMQLACSSLVAEALNRCIPMTVFSRSTECHNQDKVSMGATSARHARAVIDLIQKAAAIHLLALCQAADLRGPERLGQTRKIYEKIRSLVPPLVGDREMDGDIEKVTDLIKRGELP